MTDEQKYAEVLKELGALLADKNGTIDYLQCRVVNLEEKLKAAEAELADTKEELVTSAKMYVDLAQRTAEGGAA